MYAKEITAGRVRILRNGSVHRESPIVIHLSGYGMTCSELGTTNGSIRMVAELLIRMAGHVPAERLELEDSGYDFTVEVEGKMLDMKTFNDDTLYALLRAIYDGEIAAKKTAVQV